MSQTESRARTPYEKKLFWRKVRMYAMMVVTFIACFIISVRSFHHSYFDTIDPQIRSAYMEIARLLPTLETDEASLTETYALLARSREEAKDMGIALSRDTIASSRTATDISDGSYTLERITRLTVGHNGRVLVARKDTGEILAHRNANVVGKTLMVCPINNRDIIDTAESNALATSVVNYRGIPDLDLSRFSSESDARKLRLRHLILFSGDGGRVRLSSVLGSMLFGSIVPYGRYYIVCGIDMLEYLLFISRALFISVIVCAILWLFVHFICLTLDRHELNGRDLCRQLIAYSLVLAIGVFCLSWYIQVLNGVTNELNAMQRYADFGVDTLSSFKDAQKQVSDWFDEQYLTQCRIARDYVKSRGTENITRKDLADLSDLLRIQHIYVYDPNGRVIVTNSPYDHFKLSDDPSDQSHAFLPLLEGVDHVVQPPMPDELSGTRRQFIGVSLRNEKDLADGFVQISFDPALRDYMIRPLGVDSVLNDMTVGLPTHAVAFNKEDLTISATTGFGYVGESIEDFGYNAEKLKANRNGFLTHGGKTYYAGFGESENCYLVPVDERTTNNAALAISLRIALVLLAGQALILLMALFNYQRSVVDDAPPPEAVAEDAAQDAAPSFRFGKDSFDISGIVKVPEKTGFEDRWHVKASKSELTPGDRIKAIAYKLVLILCVWNLLLVIYGSLSGVRLSGLSYVLSGNWEKGVNIFAFTSCLFLLFALYVFVTLANRLLYNIARVSDMRTETICLLLRSSLKYVCVIAFIYYGLSQFGIPTQALLASAGIITLAVSVGAKSMVEDIIAGFFILLEGNFKVGDYISVGSWSGWVQEIGLRTTRVNFFQDTKIFNNSSMKDIVNSDHPVARITLKLPVGLTASLSEIEEILKAELPGLMTDVPGVIKPPRYDGVDGIKEGNMNVRISMQVKCGPHLAANRELQRRIKLMFERHGFQIPVNPAYSYKTDITPDKGK